MSTISIYGATSERKKIRKRTLSQRVEIGVTAVFFIMLVIICLLSLLFLSHSNRIATRGDRLKFLNDERVALITENQVLGMKISQLQSLDSLENDKKIQSMVEVKKPLFIRGDVMTAKK